MNAEEYGWMDPSAVNTACIISRLCGCINLSEILANLSASHTDDPWVTKANWIRKLVECGADPEALVAYSPERLNRPEESDHSSIETSDASPGGRCWYRFPFHISKLPKFITLQQMMDYACGGAVLLVRPEPIRRLYEELRNRTAWSVSKHKLLPPEARRSDVCALRCAHRLSGTPGGRLHLPNELWMMILQSRSNVLWPVESRKWLPGE